MAFAFRESLGKQGEKHYWPNNTEARELLDFMGSPWLIGEAKMDKIWAWMGKLGHEVYIDEQVGEQADEEEDFYIDQELFG